MSFSSEPPELTPVFDLLVDQDGVVRWNGRTVEDDDILRLRQAWRELSVQPAVGVHFADETAPSTRLDVLQDIHRIFGCGRDFACVLTARAQVGE